MAEPEVVNVASYHAGTLIASFMGPQLLFLFSYPDVAEGNNPDSKFHGANMGPIWGRQVPGGPHAGPMKFVIWVVVTN